MIIVSIMVELINKQKIRKRTAHSGGAGRGSLLQNAQGMRLESTGYKRGSGKSGLLRNKLVYKKRRKKIKLEKPGRQRRPKRSGSERTVPKFSAAKVFKAITPRISKIFHYIGLKYILISVFAATIVTIGAVCGMDYFKRLHMFDNFALHTDYKIDDVLYESLPSEYDGRGSGDAIGAEPMLLSIGEPATYKVKSGDTLSAISKNNGIKIGTLISYNKITDVRRLQVGTELKIPKYDGVPYDVKAGDSLSSIAKKYKISINSILDSNNLESDLIQPGDILFIPGGSMNDFDYKKAMGTLFIYPTVGRLSSGFGYRADPFTGKRRFHNGLDLANARGTRVSATMSGRVADIGDRPSGYGKYVIIKHSNGYQSLYAHLSKISVRKGQYVYQGNKIGEMGNTGRSTGPHLHFSIYRNNSPVNPLTYLW